MTKSAARTIAAMLAAVVAGSAASSIAAGKETWPPPGVSFYGDPGAPDISGMWLGSETAKPGAEFAPNRGPADGSPAGSWDPWPLPYTPSYQRIVDEREAAAKQGRALADISARCLPFGMPHALAAKVYPDEIIQTPGQVSFFINSAFPIIVWTDGRPHPKDLKPSYNGHSTGQWIGDTLFVDTVGINGETSLDHGRNPHSDQLKIRWSVRRVAPDRLHIHVTLDDPEAFTEPVTTVNIWRRKTDPRWQLLDDGSCFENNRTKVDEHGNTDGFIKY